MSRLKVFIEHDSAQYVQMFTMNGWEVVQDLYDADLLQLEGGAGVSPELYGEAKHKTTWSSKAEDNHTRILYNEALSHSIHIAGICRGSQFLSVMGGGGLWQDVDGHANVMGHDLIDMETGIIIKGASSTHHQNHRPANNAIIICVSFPQLCTFKSHMDGEKEETFLTEDTDSADNTLTSDIEAFYDPDIKALGCQWHPEFFGTEHPCQMYYFDLISKYLGLRAGE